MARLMSFALTTEQIRARTKTVTRRLNWDYLRIGDELRAVEKVMGLKKGERPVDLARIRVVSVSRERLKDITIDEVGREGFSGITPAEFVAMFCRHMRVRSTTWVTRIEFEYVL